MMFFGFHTIPLQYKTDCMSYISRLQYMHPISAQKACQQHKWSLQASTLKIYNYQHIIAKLYIYKFLILSPVNSKAYNGLNYRAEKRNPRRQMDMTTPPQGDQWPCKDTSSLTIQYFIPSTLCPDQSICTHSRSEILRFFARGSAFFAGDFCQIFLHFLVSISCSFFNPKWSVTLILQ